MKKLIGSIASRVSDIATSKVTQKAATTVVDKIGPHTAIKKVGTITLLVGLIIALCGWFLLTSWPSTVATIFGIGLIVLGLAMRYVNSILVSLVVRLLQSLASRFLKLVKRLRSRFNQKKTDSTPSPTESKD